MAFCPKCGAEVQGGFCGRCGAAVGAAGSSAGTPPQPAAAGAGLEENVAGALCYLAGFITGILFLALAPHNQNRNIRFHAFQSIFLSVAIIAIYFVSTILSFVLPGVLSALLWIAMVFLWLASFVLWVLLMVRTYNRDKFVLPVIGELAEKQAG